MKAKLLLLATLLGLAAPIAGAQDKGPVQRFDGATGWLNSAPLAADELRGKVVLVDFWTYTCINWLRTVPYVRAWAEKYKDQGLVVVGVHSPEFEFEKNVENVQRAVRDMNIAYPVAIDSNYRDLASLQQQRLAGGLSHRCAGARSLPPPRRRGVRGHGENVQQLLAEAGKRASAGAIW